MVGGYTVDHRTIKIGGCAHARGWALALHNTVLGKLSHVSNFLKQNQVSSSINAKFHVPKCSHTEKIFYQTARAGILGGG